MIKVCIWYGGNPTGEQMTLSEFEDKVNNKTLSTDNITIDFYVE